MQVVDEGRDSRCRASSRASAVRPPRPRSMSKSASMRLTASSATGEISWAGLHLGRCPRCRPVRRTCAGHGSSTARWSPAPERGRSGRGRCSRHRHRPAGCPATRRDAGWDGSSPIGRWPRRALATIASGNFQGAADGYFAARPSFWGCKIGKLPIIAVALRCQSASKHSTPIHIASTSGGPQDDVDVVAVDGFGAALQRRRARRAAHD